MIIAIGQEENVEFTDPSHDPIDGLYQSHTNTGHVIASSSGRMTTGVTRPARNRRPGGWDRDASAIVAPAKVASTAATNHRHMPVVGEKDLDARAR